MAVGALHSVGSPYEFKETWRQVFEIGWRSLPLVALSGFAVGVVLSMHTRASPERFGAEAMIPAGLAIPLVRETGPLAAGLLVAGRSGAGIGAELGAMKVTEQIDALEAVAVDSFKFLVVTRILACRTGSGRRCASGCARRCCSSLVPTVPEVLSASGRARIDSAMSTYLKYLPSNPIVVEGYAPAPTSAERLRLSRRRAGIVRQYIVGEYDVPPQNVGFIGLGEAALNSPDKQRWDGVALTLFLNRGELQVANAAAP